MKKYNQDSVQLQLQQLHFKCRWAVADSSLLRAIARGEEVQRGKAGRRLERLVRIFTRLKAPYLLLFAVGFFELTRLLLRQLNTAEPRLPASTEHSPAPYPAYFFVGFGAGAEEYLFDRYCVDSRVPVARIKQTEPESMMAWHRISPIAGISALFTSLALARQAMNSLPEACLPWKADFLTFVGMRLGSFSYYSAWFADLKEKAPYMEEVCFVSPDTSAFAAVNAMLQTRFLQHGLLAHSLIFPEFDSVDAITADEASHLRYRLPRALVNLDAFPTVSIVTRNPECVLVTSIYGSNEEMLKVVPLLEFLVGKGLNIHVRPHPREDPEFWLSSIFSFDIVIEDSNEPFDAAIERLRPSLVVSWFSTTLMEALCSSTIPVSVSFLDDKNLVDTVYPIFARCLQWPSNHEDLVVAMSSKSGYEDVLSRLQLGVPVL